MKIAMLIVAAMTVGAAPVLAADNQPLPVAAPPATLSTIVHPPIQIASAAVLDANGASIGTVERVEVTPAGVPTKVAVALTGKPDQIAVLDAGAVAYDAVRNQIIARRPG